MTGPATDRNERFLTADLMHRRKLNLMHPVKWEHHRGGWNDVTAFIASELCCEDGTAMINSVEEIAAAGRVISTPWVGFSHETPRHDYAFPDIERLQRLDTWKASALYCRGLWVLSSYNKAYWESCRPSFPVSFVHYPVAEPSLRFSLRAFEAEQEPALLFIGEYLRRREPFLSLRAPGYRKILVQGAPLRRPESAVAETQQVTRLDRLDETTYDRYLSEGIVFLNLSDAGANTTIVECIARGTPVMVNSVGGVSEYLGRDYPLYYDSLEEAEAKLQDRATIAHAAHHLAHSPVRQHITFDAFRQSLENSAVYRGLPIPSSQRRRFRRFDLTVMTCVYKRIECLPEWLDRMAAQDFTGSFEILLWNNNLQVLEQVQDIVERYASRLTIRVVHSADNLYCGVRLAAPNLMRSETLVVCDDDVLPEPSYLQTFWRKHQDYGENTVICVRGHRFRPHRLDTDHPEQAWRIEQYLDFYDESGPEQLLHFFHADNCVISRALLKRAASIDLANPEFVLVDDYWLSYVISHILGARLQKIKGDHILRFHPRADDARVAMFEDPLVREQRVNFYIYHMQHGWPFGASAEASVPAAIEGGA